MLCRAQLLYVDGLDREHVRAAFAQLDDADEAPARTVPLLGASGRLWGVVCTHHHIPAPSQPLRIRIRPRH